MNDNNVRPETMVRVRFEPRVTVTYVLGLLHLVVVCTRICAFESAAIVVKFAALTTLRWIGF